MRCIAKAVFYFVLPVSWFFDALSLGNHDVVIDGGQREFHSLVVCVGIRICV